MSPSLRRMSISSCAESWPGAAVAIRGWFTGVKNLFRTRLLDPIAPRHTPMYLEWFRAESGLSCVRSGVESGLSCVRSGVEFGLSCVRSGGSCDRSGVEALNRSTLKDGECLRRRPSTPAIPHREQVHSPNQRQLR